MKKNKSLITICLIQFCTLALLIFSFCFIGNYISNHLLDNSFPTIYDLLDYEDALKVDDFSHIPIKRLSGSNFAVYDADLKLLYTSNKNISDNLKEEDINFISNNANNIYYDMISLKDEFGNLVYELYENTYDEDTSSEITTGYAKLNSDYEIISGNLFKKYTSFTPRQLELIRGIYSNNESIEKYDYETNDNQSRILVFVSPNFTLDTYNDVVNKSKMVWIIGIPLMVIMVLTSSWLFMRKMKKNLNTLSMAICGYQDGDKLDITTNNLPKEFKEITDSFNELMIRLNKALAEKNQMYQERQRIIADVSHDLKTPLTVIQGYSKAFIDELVPNDKKKQYMYAIYNKSIIAVSQLESLFSYINMEHPEYKLNPEKIDINSKTKDYLAEKYNEIELNKFNLEVDIPDNEVYVNIDFDAFKRVYDNLISNTMKYNKAGVTIYFQITTDKNYVYITIGDNGIGVADNIKNTIFDAFVTSNEARTSGKGCGLGMAIVKRLVELNAGNIELKNSKGKLKTEFLVKFRKVS